MGILKVYTDATASSAEDFQGAACIMQYDDSDTLLLFSKKLNFPKGDMLSLTTELEAVKMAAKRIRQTIQKYGLSDITHIQFHTDNSGVEYSLKEAFNAMAPPNGKRKKARNPLMKEAAKAMKKQMAKLPYSITPKMSVHHNNRDTGLIPLADLLGNITSKEGTSFKGRGLHIKDLDEFLDGEFPETAHLLIDEPDIVPPPAPLPLAAE